MDGSIQTIIMLFLLVVASAYFSAIETAISSMNRTKIKQLASAGDRRALRLLKLDEDADKLLTTVLIGNTTVNIVATTLAAGFLVKTMGNMGIPVAMLVMSVVIVIFGEVSPKSIAKNIPEKIALFSVGTLNVLVKLFTPLCFVLRLLKHLINCVVKAPLNAGVTEEEILTLVDEAQSGGSINEQESDMIRGAIEFNDLEVMDVLTPRVEVSALDENAELNEIISLFSQSGFSRLPVYHEDIDHVIGVVHQKDFFSGVLSGEKELKDIITPVLYVSPTTKISKLLHIFQNEHSHMAVVVDDYGGTNGIVTLEDVIEEIVGEIWDEHDRIISEIEQIAPDMWKVLGSARLHRLFEEVGLEEDEEADYQSVNGWVTDVLERIPKEGESFIENQMEIKVTRADQRHVIEILVRKIATEEQVVSIAEVASAH